MEGISGFGGELHRVEQAGESSEDEHGFTQAEWWLWQVSRSAGTSGIYVNAGDGDKVHSGFSRLVFSSLHASDLMLSI